MIYFIYVNIKYQKLIIYNTYIIRNRINLFLLCKHFPTVVQMKGPVPFSNCSVVAFTKKGLKDCLKKQMECRRTGNVEKVVRTVTQMYPH